MSDERRRRVRKRVVMIVGPCAMALLLLYAIALTPWAINLASRHTRGTKYHSDIIRWQLTNYGTPVEKALATNRVRVGDTIEAFQATHGPHKLETFGRYTRIQPVTPPGCLVFESYGLLAKDGRLVTAGWWTCTGSVEFFDVLSPAEHSAVRALIEEDRGRRQAAWKAAQMALAGFAAVDEPWNLAPPSDSPD